MIKVSNTFSLGPNKCSTNPCKNGATCLTIGADNYSCLCTSYYTGTHCENAVPTQKPTTPKPSSSTTTTEATEAPTLIPKTTTKYEAIFN